MEEVWKDMNLGSLNEQSSRPSSSTCSHPNLMFQDFLARPSIDDPPNTVLCSAPPPPLVTALSLSSPPHFHKPTLHTPTTDRRNKRMIKNRESAARSHGAYTNELELEVAQLKEENARLRRLQQQLSEIAAAKKQKNKCTLYRASTAPF
ncbi:hypothetical protein Fmac_002641 [Flemingia macrophylla]|uniref:BZIP domain-containing protein n=1 Tax=Flemingia macrophylla TaxID=520843 RepID=A0ABD1NKH5_9FABA